MFGKGGCVSVEMVAWKRDISEMQRKRGLAEQSSQSHAEPLLPSGLEAVASAEQKGSGH